MASNRTIRKITNLKTQRMETYRYWKSRTPKEKTAAVVEVVREAYFAKAIDLDRRPPSKKNVRVIRSDWKAA